MPRTGCSQEGAEVLRVLQGERTAQTATPVRWGSFRFSRAVPWAPRISWGQKVRSRCHHTRRDFVNARIQALIRTRPCCESTRSRQDPTRQRAPEPETHKGDFAKLRRVTQPEMLLTSDPGDARPLWLVTESDLPRWLSEQPVETATWVRSNGFQAERHRVLTLPAANGQIASAVLGLGALRTVAGRMKNAEKCSGGRDGFRGTMSCAVNWEDCAPASRCASIA